MKLLFASLISFLSGSLMFSYWIGRIKGIDIRKVRDGNPGAFNLWHCSGPLWGFIGIILDFMKGFIPVFIFSNSGFIQGWEIIPVGISPVLGHTFSPFLNFKGGKGVDVSFGVWTGISFFKMSLILAIISFVTFIFIKLILKKELSPENSSFIIVPAFIFFSLYLILFKDLNIIILSVINTGIIIFKHWKDISFARVH